MLVRILTWPAASPAAPAPITTTCISSIFNTLKNNCLTYHFFLNQDRRYATRYLATYFHQQQPSSFEQVYTISQVWLFKLLTDNSLYKTCDLQYHNQASSLPVSRVGQCLLLSLHCYSLLVLAELIMRKTLSFPFSLWDGRRHSEEIYFWSFLFYYRHFPNSFLVQTKFSYIWSCRDCSLGRMSSEGLSCFHSWHHLSDIWNHSDR